MSSVVSWLDCLTENGLKIIALAGAAVAFTVSLLQYRIAQRWKRMEWVANEMDAFLADPQVIAALRMIDWGKRRIELYPAAQSEADRFVIVDDDGVAGALERHQLRPNGFSRHEAAIRDVFDHFLDRLERFQSFVDARLLAVKDVRPYLQYWAEHIIAAKEDDSSVDRIVQLRRFIVAYEYDGVCSLFSKIARQPWPNDQEKPEPYPCRIGTPPQPGESDTDRAKSAE